MSDEATLAVAKLAAKLAELRGRYDDLGEDRSELRHQRAYAFYSLVALEEMCADLGFGNKITAPFTRLMIGLETVAGGKADNLFRPQAGKKTEIISSTLNYRGRIAAAQTFVMKKWGGVYTKDEAAEFVIRTLGEKNIDWLEEKTSRSAPRIKAVSRWRDDVDKYEASLDGYNAMMSVLLSETAKDPSARMGITRSRLLKLREWIEYPLFFSAKNLK